MILTPARCVDSHFDVIPAHASSSLGRPAHSFLNNPGRHPLECRANPAAGKGSALRVFSESRIASRRCGTLHASLLTLMEASGRNDMGSFVVVALDLVKQGVTEIRSALDSLGIQAEVVESGRRLRWTTAVVLRIPEHRIPEALLVLGLKGFTDVMAYQSTATPSWGRE